MLYEKNTFHLKAWEPLENTLLFGDAKMQK